MPEVTSTIRFDAGIEQISLGGDAAPDALPQTVSGFVPGSTHSSTQLTQVLFPPSIEQSLLESFRPELDNRTILDPVNYQSALQSCQQELSQLAQDHAGRPEGDKLQRAADELQQENELFRLLAMNRHLLQQA